MYCIYNIDKSNRVYEKNNLPVDDMEVFRNCLQNFVVADHRYLAACFTDQRRVQI